MKRPFVAISIDGARGIHATGTGNYSTLCGLDGEDPRFNMTHADPPRAGEKIDCPQCFAGWVEFRKLRAADFSDQLKGAKTDAR